MVSLLLGYVYVLGGVNEQLYMLDESSGQVVDSLFIGSTGDVPNYVYLPGRTLDSTGAVGIVVNSGGFYGVPSLVYFEPVSNTIISEYPLPDSLNPMEGVVVGDTFYFSNFGKDGSGAAVYLFNNGSILDSIGVALQPIGVKYCFDRILVATRAGYLYGINPADRSKDSLFLGPTISQIGCDSQYIYVLATGNYGSDDALVFRVDGASFTFAGNSDTIRNSYVLTVGDQYVYAATFDGTLYTIERATGSLDSLTTGYSGILGLDFYDGNLYISAGAWTGDTNRVIVYNEATSSFTSSYVISSSDVGIGFLYAFDVQTTSFAEDYRKPFVYRNGVIYLGSPARVSLYDVRGRMLYRGITTRLDVSGYGPGVFIVKVNSRAYRILNMK